MAKGGKREGAGRKEGSKNREPEVLRRALVAQLKPLADTQREPMDIVLDLANLEHPKDQISPEGLERLLQDPLAALELIGRIHSWAEIVSKNAIALLPYRHRRLAPTDGKEDLGSEQEKRVRERTNTRSQELLRGPRTSDNE